MEYEPNKEEIEILKKQISVDNSKAIALLKKHVGNIVESVLDFYETLDKTSYKDTINDKRELDDIINSKEEQENNNIEISNIENIEIMRRILNEKDEIFQEKISKDIEINDKEIFTYIKFNYDTEIFQKNKINSDRNTLINSIIKPYLEQNNIEESINDDKQLLCHFLGKNSKNINKKWGLEKPAIFYFGYQISNDKNHEKINKIGTKLLVKSENIQDNNIIIGPVFIVNNWF